MRKKVLAHILVLSPRTCVHSKFYNFYLKILDFAYLFSQIRNTGMSSRKGDSKKKAQKYQNVTAFKNDLHDTSRTTKLINSTPVMGVCARCRDAIEWRKKFKKYKPLKAPKKW